MAITVKRLRIGNAIFVKAVLRNLHTSSRSASPAKLGAIRNPAPFCRRGVRSEKWRRDFALQTLCDEPLLAYFWL